MDLIVDANILFAALIKNSFSHQLLFSGKLHLYTSEFIFRELEKHKDELLKKTSRTVEDFYRVLAIFERRVIIVPLEELVEFVQEAEKISPDPDDMIYFALALKLNCAIWSEDKKLKKQDQVKVYNTTEILNCK
ncbi:PIN domain-containing protein [archaeon]|nr:PIN domain-containing protein [archaeon]